ncbi:MAG: cyclic nucleotide-binding domain-containing protein [Candidatus Gracilibacteria bacterium]|nr:cyclic nucleotide-binding domain-containing protein [Candidatus Gracilibacteria bacterium]
MSILDSIELFSSLTSSERETLSLFCQERLLRSGEILFNEGDDALAFYVVKSGYIRVYKDRSDGEKLVGYVDSGGLVGEMALFDPDAPKNRMATAKAAEDTYLLVIMDYAILELSRKHEDIYKKISDIIMVRKNDNKKNNIE